MRREAFLDYISKTKKALKGGEVVLLVIQEIMGFG
jgi:hypothetical protein